MLAIGDIPKLEVRITGMGDVTVFELRFDTEEVDGCVTLRDDATGQINGQMLELNARGRADRSLDGNKWTGCWWPTFVARQPIAAPGAFAIGDGMGSIRGELGDRLAPRQVTRVPDGPWMFAPGERVSMRWTPASDLKNVPRLSLTNAGTHQPVAEVAGDVVSFTLPAGPLGSAQLFARVDNGTEEVPCPGATCLVTNQRAWVFVDLHVQ